MAKVELKSPNVSTSDINRCVEKFENLKEDFRTGPQQLRLDINAAVEITSIDFRFFAHLLLFKTELPDLLITLHFRKNRFKTPVVDPRSVASSIVQCGIWGFLQTGKSLFDVHFSDFAFKRELRPDRPEMATFDIYQHQPDLDFLPYICSGALSVILVKRNSPSGLTKNFTRKGFAEGSNARSGFVTLGYADIHKLEGMTLLRHVITNFLKNTKHLAESQPLEMLGWIAFYRILHRLDILYDYLLWKEADRDKLTKAQPALPPQSLLMSLMGFIKELLAGPVLHRLLFSYVCPAIKRPDQTTESPEQTILRLTSVWNFTKDLGHSLTELAKNCVDHSTTEQGIVSFADITFSENQDTSISDLPHFSSYTQQSGLQVYVADMGKEGVIPALVRKMKLKPSSQKPSFLIRDIEIIESGHFQFKHLLAYSPGLTLVSQTKRSTAHLGLLIFSRHVQENHGLLLASTQNISKERESVLIVGREPVEADPAQLHHHTVAYGTNYFFVIPYERDHSTLTSYLPQKSVLEQPKAGDIEGLEKLFDYELLDAEDFFQAEEIDPGKYHIVLIRPELYGIDESDNPAMWNNLFERIRETRITGKIIGCLDLDVLSASLTKNDLFRILGNWQIILPKIPLIVSNLPYEKLDDLIRLNAEYLRGNQGLPYWNSVSATLFYTYAMVRSKRFYFVNALYGETEQQFQKLNRIISRNNFNQISSTATNPEPKIEEVAINDLSDSNPAFFNGDALLPLDILLQTREGVTFFESNVDIILNTELKVNKPDKKEDNKNSIDAVIGSLPGFKIIDSHFRLGSKIHISHFYYAKRFFQNSFFASRFAFILSRDILSTIVRSEHYEDVINEGLTLVGYGIYSELMTSLIEKFVRNRLPFPSKTLLNHNLVSDSENLTFLKGDSTSDFNIRKNVIIVVPIATTFSTAVKIEEKIIRLTTGIEEGKSRHVLGPHFNVLHVSNGPMIGKPEKPGELEASLGWLKVHAAKKEVDIRAFYLDNIETTGEPVLTQKYYLSLETEWERVENCQFCFPKDFLLERPLFETDTTSVTPSLIFDFPTGREIKHDDLVRNIRLDSDVIRYGHHTRNNGHFLYSIETEKFLERNEDHDDETNNGKRVTNWLLGIKEQGHFKRSDHVLLITTCHYSNASFINLVNEVLFSSTANIVHYDPSNDYIQNFEIIYGDEITKADKLVFVDDSLKSGASFSKIYDFVHYAMFRRKMDKEFAGLAGCIVLKNKAQESTEQFVRSKLSDPELLFAFANYHLFTSLNHDEISPLVIEEERYILLSQNSFLDSLKTHFLKQRNKLVADRRRVDKEKEERHLKMLLATHGIYQYFTKNPDKTELENFDAFKSALTAPKHPDDLVLAAVTNDEILKVLTQSPFSQYKPLRIYVFKWVLHLLKDHIDQVVSTQIDQGSFSVENFTRLKFLIRRAGLLKSNFLISRKFIDFLKKLHGPTGIKALMGQQDTTKIYALKYFNIFYAAQVKELLLHNEARALNLERELVTPRDTSGNSSRFLYLLRILRIENSIVIQKFYDLIQTEPEWKGLYPTFESLTSIEPITDLLKKGITSQHPKYLWLQDFLRTASSNGTSSSVEALWESNLLANYLWIRRFLELDKNYTESLDEKTRIIFDKLKLLVDPFPQTSDKKVGAFCYVKTGNQDKDSDYHLVYDQNHDGSREIDREYLKKETFLRYFLDGTGPPKPAVPDRPARGYELSIVELHRNNGSWTDLYELEEEIIFKMHDEVLENNIVGEHYNRIILLRINKRISATEERAQGVIAIYFNSPDEKITDLNLTRFLHLLREPFSDFVARHHENNEFRDWSIAEAKRRLNVLYGHGRETMIELANIEVKVRPVVLMMEEMRHMVLSEMTLQHFDRIYTQSQVIDRKYLEELKDLANIIFESDQVEDVVPCAIDLIAFEGSFSFNKRLLKWVCFELFVNAKKNRWIFFPGETIGIDGEIYDKNLLEISASVGDQLVLKIRNTAPHLHPDQVKTLSDPEQNIKKNEESSGTSLIKSVISKFLPGSYISFKSEMIDDALRLAWFEVTLCLNPM